MKRSTERILTTHVGSLPRPDDLMALYRENAPDDKLQPRLGAAVDNIVRRQAETGIDVVNDGEFGKAMRSAMDFGAWWSYVYPRLAGFELSEEQAKKGRPALVDIYDWWFSMDDDIAGYRKWAAFQVEAVNHAPQGIQKIASASISAGAAARAAQGRCRPQGRGRPSA